MTSSQQTIVETIGFEKISQDCLRLMFGETRIELHASGKILFSTPQASIVLEQGMVSLKNSKSTIELNAEGHISIDGQQLRQESREHIRLDARKNIYLNSE